MSNQIEESEAPAERVRPSMRIGLWLTAAAAVTVVVYLQLKAMTSMPPQSVGQLLLTISVADIGQFVSGVAGALAFLWLVLAYQQQNRQLEMQQQELKLQRRELALQRAETKRLADEATAQVEATARMADQAMAQAQATKSMVAQAVAQTDATVSMAAQATAQVAVMQQTRAAAVRDGFIAALDLYERQLAQEAARLYEARCRVLGPSMMPEYDKALEDFGRGDRYVFFRRLLRQLTFANMAAFFKLFEDTGGGHSRLATFCEMVETVMRHAQEVDQNMVQLCKFAPWHAVYEILKPLMDADQKAT